MCGLSSESWWTWGTPCQRKLWLKKVLMDSRRLNRCLRKRSGEICQTNNPHEAQEILCAERIWSLGEYLGNQLHLLNLILLFPGHLWLLFLLDFTQGLGVSSSSNYEILFFSLKGVFRKEKICDYGR